MRKRFTYVAGIVILAVVAGSACFAQQKAPAAKPAGASAGKEYASSSLGPGVWHIDYLALAAQKVIDQGDAALVPSIRPTGIKMVSYGDANDPFAASINLNPNHVLSGKTK